MQRRVISSLMLIVTVVFTLTGPAGAAVPVPTCTNCPPCIVMDPAGDFVLTINVGSVFICNPLPGFTVSIDFGGCPGRIKI